MTVDRDTLASILTVHLASYREMSHSALVTRLESPHSEGRLDVIEGTAPDGTAYTIETNILWDDRPQRHIRVMSDLSAGHRGCLLGFLPVFMPTVSDGFIVAPDGRFIDE